MVAECLERACWITWTEQKGKRSNRENKTMPSDLARDSVFAGGAEEIGPLEARHIESQAYRNAAEPTRVTTTHWHIAWANGLGWGFDGMDGAILALVAPLLLKEFVI